jgi:hypothetical protein
VRKVNGGANLGFALPLADEEVKHQEHRATPTEPPRTVIDALSLNAQQKRLNRARLAFSKSALPSAKWSVFYVGFHQIRAKSIESNRG